MTIYAIACRLAYSILLRTFLYIVKIIEPGLLVVTVVDF